MNMPVWFIVATEITICIWND